MCNEGVYAVLSHDGESESLRFVYKTLEAAQAKVVEVDLAWCRKYYPPAMTTPRTWKKVKNEDTWEYIELKPNGICSSRDIWVEFLAWNTDRYALLL